MPGGGNPLRDHSEAEGDDANSAANNFQRTGTEQPYLYDNNRGREAFGADDTQQNADVPTMQETRHMRPTNNFEEITEGEFDRRERAKAEYRLALQQQITDTAALRDSQKKKDLIEDVKQEQRIFRQLVDMREDYIQEEIKKGNTEVRAKLGRIDMLQPPSEGDALSAIDKRRDRSKSKSRSPDARQPVHASGAKGSLPGYADRQPRSKSKSKLDSVQQQVDNRSNHSGQRSHLLPYPSPSRMVDTASQDYADQRGHLGDLRASTESLAYDPGDQLSRLNRLQEELESKYKQ